MKQKISSKNELIKIRDQIRMDFEQMQIPDHSKQMVQIRVGMATCGIASGAKEVFEYLKEETEYQAIDAAVMQTGCLGYCYAEPTVEVILPGEDPVVFGYVDKKKAQEIIDVYVNMGKLVYPLIPLNYKTIDEI